MGEQRGRADDETRGDGEGAMAAMLEFIMHIWAGCRLVPGRLGVQMAHPVWLELLPVAAGAHQ